MMSTSCSAQSAVDRIRRGDQHPLSAVIAPSHTISVPLRAGPVVRFAVARVAGVSSRQCATSRRVRVERSPKPQGRRHGRRHNLVWRPAHVVIPVAILMATMQAYGTLYHQRAHREMAVGRSVSTGAFWRAQGSPYRALCDVCLAYCTETEAPGWFPCTNHRASW